MKKVVLKLDLPDDKAKQKALKAVSTLSGIDSISMDMKERKLTVIGAVDPTKVVSKLRKLWPTTDMIWVGPAVEPKEEGKKEEEKKKEGEAAAADGKKDQDAAKKEGEGEKGGDGKKEEGEAQGKKEGGDQEEKKKAEGGVDLELVKAHRAYYNVPHHYMPTYYNAHVHSIEENPNACVIS